MSTNKVLIDDKLVALDGIDAALRVSLTWLENAFENNVDSIFEGHSVEAIKNPITTAILATHNLQIQLNLWLNIEKATATYGDGTASWYNTNAKPKDV